MNLLAPRGCQAGRPFIGPTRFVLVHNHPSGTAKPSEADLQLLALIGASGSGKSSLALAGLIPSIQRGELAASAKWSLVRCRPGTRPWESCSRAID